MFKSSGLQISLDAQDEIKALKSQIHVLQENLAEAHHTISELRLKHHEADIHAKELDLELSQYQSIDLPLGGASSVFGADTSLLASSNSSLGRRQHPFQELTRDESLQNNMALARWPALTKKARPKEKTTTTATTTTEAEGNTTTTDKEKESSSRVASTPTLASLDPANDGLKLALESESFRNTLAGRALVRYFGKDFNSITTGTLLMHFFIVLFTMIFVLRFLTLVLEILL